MTLNAPILKFTNDKKSLTLLLGQQKETPDKHCIPSDENSGLYFYNPY